jgi:hypothetical protein
MTFKPYHAVGYSPTIEDIMEELGVDSPTKARLIMLLRCKQLYQDAQDKGNLESFDTKQEFIVCHSSYFYQTLVNMGHGNAALVISDDYSSDVYFFMFSDKVPTRFRPVVASHESLEYDLVKDEGLEQTLAHRKASEKEIETADKLGLKKDYLDYLKVKYPTKLDELIQWKIV